jgi:hypothetical protein
VVVTFIWPLFVVVVVVVVAGFAPGSPFGGVIFRPCLLLRRWFDGSQMM